MSTRVEMFQETAAKDALVVVAFSGAGQAAPIAAQYLAKHLDVPLIGHLRIPELDHLMAVQHGRATSIVRIFGGEVACNLDSGCSTIFLITTEVPLPEEVVPDVATAILEWARHEQVHLLLALEGVGRDDEGDTPAVYCASADDEVLDELGKAGVKTAGQGLIAGLAAHLALSAADHEVRSGVIMVEAHRRHPDGRAAAELVSALDRLLPDIKVDPAPLLAEALELEEEIRKKMPAKPVVPRAQHTFI